uniref:Uncharacterized protein n=1 Tax=Vibrio phage P018-4 TaxID=3229728 RepID=A0AB39AJW1_9CAUD
MSSKDNLHKTFTVFTSKMITDKQRKHYYAKYLCFNYKRGDITYIVVCHGDETSFKEREESYE